ncbi:hypothetical protein EMCG_07437 [[Emmonsia] crescens]|uniref:Uncharacterized protein n=1 Tax=[Emmonsia] crescens TaxID=73230 RepID=A0A0G2I881_9EURO|nr:hypothetical protein EMCG_07437 [Emmonsia crescens UAMH 3008]
MLRMGRGDIEALFSRDQSVDYTQGYGHLLFPPPQSRRVGNLVKHEYRGARRRKRGWRRDKIDDPRIDSLAANVEAMQVLQQAFPLTRLPLEIRYRIYGFLLEPLSGSYYGDLPEMMGGGTGSGLGYQMHPIVAPLTTRISLTQNRSQTDMCPKGQKIFLNCIKQSGRELQMMPKSSVESSFVLTARFEVNSEIDEITAVSTGDDDDDDADDCGSEKETEEGACHHILMKMNDAPPHVRDSFGAMPFCSRPAGLPGSRSTIYQDPSRH